MLMKRRVLLSPLVSFTALIIKKNIKLEFDVLVSFSEYIMAVGGDHGKGGDGVNDRGLI